MDQCPRGVWDKKLFFIKSVLCNRGYVLPQSLFTKFIESFLICEGERLLQRERKRRLFRLPCVGGGKHGQQSLSSSTPTPWIDTNAVRLLFRNYLCYFNHYNYYLRTNHAELWETVNSFGSYAVALSAPTGVCLRFVLSLCKVYIDARPSLLQTFAASIKMKQVRF